MSEPRVFPSPHQERAPYVEFTWIPESAQNQAGKRILDPPRRERPEQTDARHGYGFH